MRIKGYMQFVTLQFVTLQFVTHTVLLIRDKTISNNKYFTYFCQKVYILVVLSRIVCIPRINGASASAIINLLFVNNIVYVSSSNSFCVMAPFIVFRPRLKLRHSAQKLFLASG